MKNISQSTDKNEYKLDNYSHKSGFAKIINFRGLLTTGLRMSIQSARDPWGHVVAGSVSGFVACVGLQPFDVIKTRMQQQSMKNVAPYYRQGDSPRFYTTLVNIAKQDSVKGLWRGTIPTLWRNVPGGALYFVTLGTIRTNMAKRNVQSEGVRHQLAAWENAVAGAAARGGIGAILLPLTVLKARFESDLYHYKSMPAALSTIARHEGWRGLFSGLSATFLRDAPQAGLYVSFYEYFKHDFTSKFGLSPGLLVNFTSGSIAGLCATVCTHPADVIKTRSQLNPAKYGNFFRAMRVLYKEEGITIFMRGIVPRCLRKSSGQAITWTFYEETLRLYTSYRKSTSQIL